MSWSLFEKSSLQSARPILQKAFSRHALENARQVFSGRRLGSGTTHARGSGKALSWAMLRSAQQLYVFPVSLYYALVCKVFEFPHHGAAIYA